DCIRCDAVVGSCVRAGQGVTRQRDERGGGQVARLRRWVVAVAAVGAISVGIAAAGTGGDQWTSAGQNLQNTRSNSSESKIGVGNVATLQKKWEFTTGGDVSATPAVDGANVYFPDWGGNLYAVGRATGQQVWKASIAQATGIPGDKARSTPALSDDK